MKNHPGDRAPWWKTTLVTEHLDEKTTLVRENLYEKTPWWHSTWWKTTLVTKHPDEKNILATEHPDEKPPWLQSTLTIEHPNPNPNPIPCSNPNHTSINRIHSPPPRSNLLWRPSIIFFFLFFLFRNLTSINHEHSPFNKPHCWLGVKYQFICILTLHQRPPCVYKTTFV